MTLTNPKPGGHATGEKLTSTNVDAAFAQLPYAVDGNAGGAYAPSSAIALTGSGMTIGGISVGEAVTSRVCTVAVTGTTVGAGTKFQIASSLNDAGYTIHTGNDTIAVPTTGIYLWTWTLNGTNADTTNPWFISGAVQLNAVTVGTVDGPRYSATAADVIVSSGSGVFEVTNISHLVTLIANISGNITITSSTFSLVRVAQ
jgi:hypothetical protein